MDNTHPHPAPGLNLQASFNGQLRDFQMPQKSFLSLSPGDNDIYASPYFKAKEEAPMVRYPWTIHIKPQREGQEDNDAMTDTLRHLEWARSCRSPNHMFITGKDNIWG
jgi:hypothetical protein